MASNKAFAASEGFGVFTWGANDEKGQTWEAGKGW